MQRHRFEERESAKGLQMFQTLELEHITSHGHAHLNVGQLHVTHKSVPLQKFGNNSKKGVKSRKGNEQRAPSNNSYQTGILQLEMLWLFDRVVNLSQNIVL